MNIDLYGSLLTAMAILLGAAVIGPILSSKRKLAGWVNFILVSVAAIMLLNISYVTLFQGGGGEHAQKMLGIYFLVDPFAGFFIAIISFMAIMSAFYSIQYMEHYPDYKLWSYYLTFPLFILGMIAIVTVDDLTTGFTVAWQIMTIASYFLIRFEYRTDRKREKREQVPHPDGAGLGPDSGRRRSSSAALRWAIRCMNSASRWARPRACRCTSSTGCSSSASASRPVCSPSDSSGCPTRTP